MLESSREVTDKMTELADAIQSQNVFLADEIILPPDEIVLRRQIGSRVLDAVPSEAISRLQLLQPAIGCLNRCNFCAQDAAPVTRELDMDSLRAIFGGLRGAMHAMGVERAGEERSHKDGVIFPFLDNDIASYPHLPDYLVGVRSLGASTRLVTVGWSRHNTQLQAMHEQIATNHVDDVDGIKFSLTPYTFGWRTNPEEYMKDLGNALATYRPFFEQKGPGRRTACVELRFAPDILVDELTISRVGEYRVVRCGEYALVAAAEELEAQGFSRIVRMGAGGPELDQPGVESLQLIGDVESLQKAELNELFKTASTDNLEAWKGYRVLVKKGRGHIFQNADGPYYCFDPLKAVDSTFWATHYYPKTDRRLVSGLLDATRPFLNQLIALKQQRGIGPRDNLPHAGQAEVDEIIEAMTDDVSQMEMFSPRRAEYIKKEVLPLVCSLVRTFEVAGFEPADFLTYGLVIDTGVIVNLGKAASESKGLASGPDIPLTPNEEKGYGAVSQSSIRGNTWRISPVDVVSTADKGRTGYGRKSLPLIEETVNGGGLSLGVYEWNPQTFSNRGPQGERLRSFLVPLGDLVQQLRTATPLTGKRQYLLPGIEPPPALIGISRKTILTWARILYHSGCATCWQTQRMYNSSYYEQVHCNSY